MPQGSKGTVMPPRSMEAGGETIKLNEKEKLTPQLAPGVVAVDGKTIALPVSHPVGDRGCGWERVLAGYPMEIDKWGMGRGRKQQVTSDGLAKPLWWESVYPPTN